MLPPPDIYPECRDCGQMVSASARTCPACGALFPANPTWSGTGYEYKSAATLLGLPLVHIAWGRNSAGKLRVAHGFVAIGQFARGVIAIGQFAAGLVTVAQFGFGILAAGQFILAGAAIAQFPIALVAIGQFPICLLWAWGQVVISPR